ncbi:MAG: hypothetical protein VCA57_04695 [Pseudomonas sp.]|uniref:hypothetical protein n=1 Tax=Pseudomonas sp. TaxID=306 RepID=UPI003981F10A
MAYIAGMDFHIDLDFSEIDLEKTEQYLKEIVRKYSDIIFRQDTEVLVRLEDGSLKVKLAIVGAIYIGVGQYGSFRSGIDYLIKDAKSLKEIVTSEIVRNGLNESDIIDSKRIYCDPDRIRRVFLAIDRLESKKGVSESELLKEVSKIKRSIRNICHLIGEIDAGLFASSVSEKYWPDDRRIPEYVRRFQIVAREEDIVPLLGDSLSSPEVNKALPRKSR